MTFEAALATLADEGPDPVNAPAWAWALGIMAIMAVAAFVLRRSQSFDGPMSLMVICPALGAVLYFVLASAWDEKPEYVAYRKQVSAACDTIVSGIADGSVKTLPYGTLVDVGNTCGDDRVTVAANAPDAVLDLMDGDIFAQAAEKFAKDEKQVR